MTSKTSLSLTEERPNSANVSQLKTLSLNFLQNISEISNEEEVPKLSLYQKCGKEILAFPLRAFVVLSCEHIFHRTCIEQHIVRIDTQVPIHPSCPICSTIIEVIREEGTLGSDKYQMVPKIRSLIDFEKKASQQSTDTIEDDLELEYMRELGLMGDTSSVGQEKQLDNASTQDQTNISVTAQEQDTSPMCLELETCGKATGTSSVISNEKGTTTVVQVNPSDQDSANETTDSSTSPLKRNSVSEPAIAVNAKEEFRPHKVPHINSTSVESDKKEKESNVLKGFIEELTANSSEVFKDLPLDGNEDNFLYLYNRITNAEAHSEIANQEVIRYYYSLGK
ncbi:1543_t:CDS:1, partial [Diversispora eburnea]